jgi:DNA-binding Lrp family transcriptional regulator
MGQPNITISMKIFAGNDPIGCEYTGKTELSRIDYRIIRSLHNNARKPVVDVAEEIGLTQKTVRHHLEEMERNGSIEYGVLFDPALCPGSTFILRVDLKAGADKLRYAQALNQRFGARLLLTFIHSNLPDSLCAYCWAPTAAQHYGMTDTISADEMVTKVGSGIVHREWSFETWRTVLLNKMARDRAE